MFSMLNLIYILQFFVFIAVWQIDFPNLTKAVLKELRRIALGEFFDDLEIGKRLSNFFGI